jgi:hypothetical protein
MAENKNAKTPTDGGTGFIDGVWPGPTAWQCQCGKAYTVTCISSKPAKQWVGLTDEDIHDAFNFTEVVKQLSWDREPVRWCENFSAYIEAKLKEKNHG